jgi:uncharacterized protein (DUF433 family)
VHATSLARELEKSIQGERAIREKIRRSRYRPTLNFHRRAVFARVQSQAMNPIKIDPEILGGTPCFAGTRVPMKTLFDVLQSGHDIEYFLVGFPTVTREQAIAVMELAKEKILSTASTASAA